MTRDQHPQPPRSTEASSGPSRRAGAEREPMVPVPDGTELSDQDLETVVGGVSPEATRSLYRSYLKDWSRG